MDQNASMLLEVEVKKEEVDNDFLTATYNPVTTVEEQASAKGDTVQPVTVKTEPVDHDTEIQGNLKLIYYSSLSITGLRM